MKNTLSIIMLFAVFLIGNTNVNAQHLSKDDFTYEPSYPTPKKTPISTSNIPPVEDCYCYYYNDFNDYQTFINQYLLLETASIRNQWYEEQKKVITDELIVRLSLDPNYAHNYSYDYLQTSFFGDNFAVPVANQFLNQAKNSSASARNRNLEDFNKTHIPAKIFQYAQSNSSYDFGDLVHYNKRLEDMTYNEAYTLWNQFGTQNVQHEQDWHYNSARVNKINKMLSHVPVFNPSPEYVNFATYIADKFKNHVNSQSLSNQVSLMTGYMIYEWQLQYLYNIPNQILSGTDYDFYYPYNDSSQISTAMNNYISNSSGNSDSFNYPSNDPDFIKRQYSMTKYNLGNLVGNFYDGKDALIEEGAKYQEFDNYSHTSRNILKDLAYYFVDEEPFVSDNYWNGAQAYGQSVSNPESLANIILSNTAYNNGFKNFGKVLEALENYPNLNELKGNLIQKFLKQNGQIMPGFINQELGKIFDFEHLSINAIGLKFSDYAKGLIINLRHGDNIYGWDIFRDSFKLKALKAIVNGYEVDFEEQIINELIGEAKCIFKNLKSLNLYKSTIKKFENSNYDLIITYGDCNGSDGCTSDEFIDLGIIQIKTPGLNSTYLDFAATLLHEGIHAELFKYMHEKDNGVNVNDRPNLLNYYFQLKGAIDPMFLDTVAQHEHMADKYVKPIAEAIRQLDGNRYPLDYYWGFAWDGLRKYGYNGYWKNGVYIELDDAGFAQKQALVNSTSPFNNQTFNQNCN